MALSPEPHAGVLRKRVLVVGGSGFIGSHLVDRLLELGAEVCVMSRSEGLLAPIGRDPRLRFVKADILDAPATIAAIRDFAPDVLVQLSAHPDGEECHAQALQSIQTNVTGTLNVLEGFCQAPGELYLYGDSVKTFGNVPVPYREETPPSPTSSYAVAKLAGWQLCELYARIRGIRAAAIRPTLVYGPRQRFNVVSFVVNCVLDGRLEIALSGGHQTRDPLYVDDAVEAYVAAIRRGDAIAGRRIAIGGGHECTVQALGEKVVRLMRGTQKVVCVAQAARPTEIWRSFSDNAEAGEALGWRPRVDLDTGLARTIDWIGANQRRPQLRQA